MFTSFWPNHGSSGFVLAYSDSFHHSLAHSNYSLSWYVSLNITADYSSGTSENDRRKQSNVQRRGMGNMKAIQWWFGPGTRPLCDISRSSSYTVRSTRSIFSSLSFFLIPVSQELNVQMAAFVEVQQEDTLLLAPMFSELGETCLLVVWSHILHYMIKTGGGRKRRCKKSKLSGKNIWHIAWDMKIL